MLRRAAELGYDFAWSTLAGKLSGKAWFESWYESRLEKNDMTFRLARVAASHYECDGFYWLGRCFLNGVWV